ncbi:acetate--CoA ligase family protein, partial [Roseicyclus amphidinii]|uniref:acetate--CoA ligase family protein n=1 Tax=Roseicyclus amphidinii TaxID=3034232 RepID=UPI0024E04807
LEAAARLGQGVAGCAPLVPGPAPVAPRLMTEAEGKTLLAAHGVPVPRRAVASTPAEAAACAVEIGFPVVLKALGVAHKTEAGAVALGLSDAGAVEAEARRMGATEFLVEEMVPGGVAEILVGILRDPAHGFVLTLGAGGVLTEVMADTASLLLPADAPQIEAALDRLRIAPLLRGYRGKPAADRAALVTAIHAVQDCAMAHAETLIELEINPLIATPDRAVAVDALIQLGETP